MNEALLYAAVNLADSTAKQLADSALNEQNQPEKRTDFRSFEQQDIERWFTYHAPTVEQIEQFVEIRTAAKILAETINRHVPAGPDKSAAIRQVREAVMTANAGIACAISSRG